MTIPAGCIGLARPSKGLKGLVGRIVAWRLALQWRERSLPDHWKPGSISHVLVSLGHDRVWESTWPTCRTSTLLSHAGAIWFCPPRRLGPKELTTLRAEAEATSGRVKYSLWANIRYLLVGSLGQDTGFVCSSGAATLLHDALGIDISGVGQPWNVTPRDILIYVNAAHWTRLTDG